ncbi:MAG TPA: AAA family ATPase [candidate division WOR-3 bacterium]|uniref:Chromosomal replication initiator protein DnaA n=1 Tax=candidate division WOR-3 bacterium TaxID=2052148 RepID=A0A7C5MDG0_UNCW3|nr:AAA family ATPase [candidate division WOR-3 bacterium]
MKKGKKKSFVEMLLSSGIISQEALRSALSEQWERGGTLEEILVERGVLTQEQLVQFLTSKFPMLHYLDLKSIDIDMEAVEHVPARIARKYLLIPVRKKGKSLAVAMANPLNREMLAEIKQVTDLKIRPFVSRIGDIKEAIEEYYREIEEEQISLPYAPERLKGEIGLPLQKEKTFETFIISESNRLAFILAKNIAETRGVSEKKLFIFGPEGVGKTHLLNAIGNYILENETIRGVLYTDALKFFTLLRNFKTDKDIDKFINTHTETDVFLFDDIDTLVGKERAQEVLYTVLSELNLLEKQIVITSSVPIKNLLAFNKKLKSFVLEFMSAGIKEPEEDLRRKVVLNLLGDEKLPKNIIDLIVKNITSNLKELETVVQEIITLKRIGQKIDEEIAKKIIEGFVEIKT